MEIKFIVGWSAGTLMGVPPWGLWFDWWGIGIQLFGLGVLLVTVVMLWREVMR